MAYTTINKPSATAFNTKLYTGTGGTQNITGVGFAPNWVWIKNRSDTHQHVLSDSVRGTGKELRSDTDGAETTNGDITAFGSDGFSISSNGQVSNNGNNFASWNWKAGTSVSGDTTGSGTLKTYTGSVNTDAGFSIISFTGNGTSGHTIPHNLGVAPAMVILKRYDSSNNWRVGHNGLTSWEYRLTLEDQDTQSSQSAVFNSTAPTSSVVTLGNSGSANGNGATYIMYSFADVQGYSKVGGSYTGNGSSDGTFCYTGMKPSFIMIKRTSGTGGWFMFDNKRDTFNLTSRSLQADTSGAENNYTASDTMNLDILSNGFKLKSTDGAVNGSGSTYIFMAFAEAPLVGTNNVPCTAR